MRGGNDIQLVLIRHLLNLNAPKKSNKDKEVQNLEFKSSLESFEDESQVELQTQTQVPISGINSIQ